jgi:hypothetical protein
MTATEYTIEIAISLEQNSELNLIELARRVYQRRGAATLPNRKRRPFDLTNSLTVPRQLLSNWRKPTRCLGKQVST